MARRRYRSWRSRGSYYQNAPSKFSVLQGLFGEGVIKIRDEFLSFDQETLTEILEEYGEVHGKSAKAYAKKAHRKWKSGETKLSGQTMERLIELVPPYLSSNSRMIILKYVLEHNKPHTNSEYIKINVEEPEEGFKVVESTLNKMDYADPLAHLPGRVLDAAKWLYDDDVTAARAMLAQAAGAENNIIRRSAEKEINLLKRTISSGQIKSASYTVTMPAGNLYITAYSPSKCYIATECFGQNSEPTITLRKFRDDILLKSDFGRKFIVWYYSNGYDLAIILSRKKVLKSFVKFILYRIVWVIEKKFRNIK